ncbi:hypothetical protein KJ708_13755 [bacterium]|nr:hypothetical protein [bacterium]MBU1917273.1 hypothetical protein [bacterium]
MSFATVINCMDGRTQLPVITFLMNRFNIMYVDSITEPGPIALLSNAPASQETKNIYKRINISVEKHKSVGIAIVAHHDCAGNPVAKEKQLIQLKDAAEHVKKHYPNLPVLELWVNENWEVEEISSV